MAEKVKACSAMEGLNKLPDQILVHLISLLPIKDAVRTSVLSTRWRYLYASIPTLDFDIRVFPSVDQMRFMDFVDRLFIFRENHDRSAVAKFLFSCLNLEAIDPLRLERWISAVIRLGIREIQIHFEYYADVLLPSNLFTCTTLVALKLNFYPEARFQVPAEVCLPNLKILHLKNAISFSNDSAEWLFSNCPVLEDLVISSYMGEHDDCKLIVSSSTLKRLTIESIYFEEYNSFEIVINAPNLVYLKYTGCERNSHEFLNVQSLAEAYINFQTFLSEQDYFSSASGLLTGISNVHTLCLHCSTLNYLEASSVPFPLFRNLTNLRITYCDPFGLSALPNLLAQCDFLEILVMELYTDYDLYEPFTWDPYPWNEVKKNKLKGSGAIRLLSRLTTLEVLSFVGGEHQMEMVKYFLESARLLENLKVQIKASMERRLMITEELLMLPKVSQKCRVIFI